jgi:hypothetical protein
MWIGKTGFNQVSSIRLIDFLLRSKQGYIVFTTRDRRMAVKLAYQNIVKVPEINEAMTTQLLQKCLIDQEFVKEQHNTTILFTEFTYLPLAIIQATAYMNENKIIIAKYLSLLRE